MRTGCCKQYFCLRGTE